MPGGRKKKKGKEKSVVGREGGNGAANMNATDRAKMVGTAFMAEDDTEAADGDVIVAGLMPALAAMQEAVGQKRRSAADAAMGAGDDAGAGADEGGAGAGGGGPWDFDTSPLEMLGATPDDLLIAYLRWAEKKERGSASASSKNGGDSIASASASVGYNVTKALRRLEKLAKWGQKHRSVLTTPPLNLVRGAHRCSTQTGKCWGRKPLIH